MSGVCKNSAEGSGKTLNISIIQALGKEVGLDLQPEKKVTNDRRWRYDLYDKEYRIAVEFEGGVFNVAEFHAHRQRKYLKQHWKNLTTQYSLFMREVSKFFTYYDKTGVSRHRGAKGYHNDIEKYNAGVLENDLLLRFDAEHIKNPDYISNTLAKAREVRTGWRTQKKKDNE